MKESTTIPVCCCYLKSLVLVWEEMAADWFEDIDFFMFILLWNPVFVIGFLWA
jgi:hypothetical protein